jgi:molybdopterin-guanine dinucleotide biosynthesis protein
MITGETMADNIIEFKGKNEYRERISNAKWAYTTRRVTQATSWSLVGKNVTPRAGDLVLAQVKRIGQHKRIELPSGRRARLFVGDDVVVAYGNRYAPDQFEAVVPEDLGPCHLVAAGGIASQMVFKHEAVKNPTSLSPVGLLTNDEGKVVNLNDFALPPNQLIKHRPPVIAVVGSSMNAGKTTTAASLIRGLTQAGLRVNAGKVTGTGAGGDIWFYKDVGAQKVMDFIDAGFPSTYLLSPAQVKQSFLTLLASLADSDPDVIVIEIADGLHQAETADLVASKTFGHHVDGVLFAVADSLGGAYGVERLRSWGINIFAVSGIITRSPLGMREFQDTSDLPVLGSNVLQSPAIEVYVREWLGHFDRPHAYRGGRR